MSSIEKPSAGRTIAGWIIIAFTMLLALLLFINPLVHNLLLSFQKWRLGSEAEFVGFSNYDRLLQDEGFFRALGNSLFSPGLFLRVLLLAAGPLALALLFMELRSGARVALQVLLAPLILFTGALITAAVYYIYYSPVGGLAQALAPSAGGEPVMFLADPERAVGVLGSLFLATGLAYALPFGTALYVAAARGARPLALNSGFSFGRFWSRTWRLVVVSVIGAAGFSIAGMEGAIGLPLPMRLGEDVAAFAYTNSFRMFNFGVGSAALQFIVIPLLLLGLAAMLLLENRRSEISIRIVPRRKEKLTAGAARGGGRIAALIIAGAVAAGLVIALIVTVGLPWLGSVVGLAGPGGGGPAGLTADFLASLALSIVLAAVTALLCWAFTATAGFAFGFLRPKGSRWLLTIIGTFIFIGPALLLVPYFLTFKDLGLVNTVLAVILPCLLSPAGVVLFTWYFRGKRDERTARDTNGAGSRTRGSFGLFSLPVLALYLLMSLNMTLLPLTMIMERRLMTAPLFLMRLRGEYLMAGPALQAKFVQLSYLLYLIPLALLILSAVLVFPRSALLVRKKGEAMPEIETASSEKLGTD